MSVFKVCVLLGLIAMTAAQFGLNSGLGLGVGPARANASKFLMLNVLCGNIEKFVFREF